MLRMLASRMATMLAAVALAAALCAVPAHSFVTTRPSSLAAAAAPRCLLGGVKRRCAC